MPGIHTKLVDLGKAGEKLIAAIKADDARKREFINEHKQNFVRQGYSNWMALSLAEEKWRAIHK